MSVTPMDGIAVGDFAIREASRQQVVFGGLGLFPNVMRPEAEIEPLRVVAIDLPYVVVESVAAGGGEQPLSGIAALLAQQGRGSRRPAQRSILDLRVTKVRVVAPEFVAAYTGGGAS